MSSRGDGVVIIVLISEGWVRAVETMQTIIWTGGPIQTLAPLSGIFRGLSPTRRYFGIHRYSAVYSGYLEGLSGASKSGPGHEGHNCGMRDYSDLL